MQASTLTEDQLAAIIAKVTRAVLDVSEEPTTTIDFGASVGLMNTEPDMYSPGRLHEENKKFENAVAMLTEVPDDGRNFPWRVQMRSKYRDRKRSPQNMYFETWNRAARVMDMLERVYMAASDTAE